MCFTWSDIFVLVEGMWGTNQSTIAEQLKVARSTISRLKSGKQHKFEREYKYVYQNLFAPRLKTPSNQTKLVNEMKEKEELRKMGFGSIIKDLDGSSYESFVVGLLKMADRNGSKGNTPKEKSSNIRKESAEQSLPPTPQEKPSDIHKESAEQTLPLIPLCEYLFSEFYDFSQTIERFLNIDPSKSLESTLTMDSLIWDWKLFLSHIKTRLEREWKNDFDGAVETYQSVVSFIDAMENYLKALKVNSVRRDAFPDDFHLVNGDSEVIDKINCHRERARNLFKTAEAAVYAERAKKIEQERASINYPEEYLPPEEDK